MNWALCLAEDPLCLCLTVAYLNLASFDYFLVEKSLAAFAICPGQCQASSWPLQLLWVQMRLHHPLFTVWRLLKPSIRLCCTSYPFHGSSQLSPPIHIVSIDQASSASAEPFQCAAVPFGDCAHHPAGFIIFARLAQLCIFMILIFHIFLIIGTYKIAHNVSDSNNHHV